MIGSIIAALVFALIAWTLIRVLLEQRAEEREWDLIREREQITDELRRDG